jgi:hypothetical protein
MLIDILPTLLCWYHQSRYGRWGLNAPARQGAKLFSNIVGSTCGSGQCVGDHLIAANTWVVMPGIGREG